MMTISTVQAPQRSEPAAQPRRDPDDSFSGALKREMKNRSSDARDAGARGADAAQARRRDSERDQAKREEVRKQSDENHGVGASAAAAQVAASVQQGDRVDDTESGEILPGEGHDETEAVVTDRDEAGADQTTEVSDGWVVSGPAVSESGVSESVVSESVGATLGSDAADGSVDYASGAAALAGPEAAIVDAELSAGDRTTAAGTSATSGHSGAVKLGSGPGPTADTQGEGAGTATAGAATAGAATPGSATESSVGTVGSGRPGDMLDASAPGASSESTESPIAAPDKSAVTAGSTKDMAAVAQAAASTVPKQAAPAAASSVAAAVVAPAPNGGFDMSRLGEGIATQLRNGERVQSLSLELHPAELGAVRVDVRQIDGVTHLVLTPDRPAGGQRLAAAMADLRHDLEHAGVDIGDLQLRQDPSGGGQEHRSGSGDRIVGQRSGQTGSAESTVGSAVTTRRPPQLAGSQQRVAIDL